MIAAKAFDPVVGVDIHMIQPPGPVPPVPIPHPFVGMLVDPMDFAPIIGATVMVNGMPRATAGTGGKCIPPHIPIGGVFIKPPGNECEVFMGSATVLADGDPLSRLAMPALSCHDIGMPSPPRVKKKTKPKSLELPTSVVLAVPMGMPVLVGGPPTISLMALGMKAAMAGLGAALKKLRKLQKASKKMKAISDKIQNAAKKAMDKLGIPPSVQNKVKKGICTVTGHPVDVATGKVFTEAVDFELPGPIPFRWERVWYSCSVYSGPLGHGWHHSFDVALREENGAVAVRLADGRGRMFEALRVGEQRYDRQERLTLKRSPSGYLLALDDGLTYHLYSTHADPAFFILAKVENLAGHQITFAYDMRGSLRRITDSVGRAITLQTDDSGRIASIHLPAPNGAADATFPIVSYSYDHDGNLINVFDALRLPQHYAYANRLLVRETDRNGLAFSFSYAPFEDGYRCIETSGTGGLYRRLFAYDVAGKRTSVTDSLGGVSHYLANELGLVIETVDPLGSKTTFEYDDYTNLVSETNALGLTRTIEYDDEGRRKAVNGFDGLGAKIAWSADGRERTIVDRRGAPWISRYNEFGRLLEKIEPTGIVERTTYDGFLAREIADSSGRRRRYEYDHHYNTSALETADGARTEWRHDHLGRPVEVRDRDGNSLRRSYDLRGLIASEEEPDGNVRSYTYDGERNVVRVSDSARDVRIDFVGTGRIAAIHEAGRSTHYTYDTEERLVAIRDSLAGEWRFRRDAAGNVVEEQSPFGLTLSYVRDALGRIVEKRWPSGRAVRYSYTPLGQIMSETFTDGTIKSYEYDAGGALVLADNGSGGVEYVRDVRGDVVEERVGNRWLKLKRTVRGSLLEVESSEGLLLTHDSSGESDSLVARYGDDKWRIETFRGSAGLVTRREFPGGARLRIARNSAGLPLSESFVAANVSHIDSRHEWSSAGRLATTVDANGGRRRFERDSLGRLIHESRSHEGKEHTSTRSGEPVEAGSGAHTTHRSEELRSFDEDGRLIRRRGADGSEWSYSWADDDTLAEARSRDGRRVSFAYDAIGRRVTKITATEERSFLWCGQVPLHEVVRRRGSGDDPRSETITWLFDGLTPLAALHGSSWTTIGTNYLGVPALAVNTRGERVWSASFDAWGLKLDESGEPGFCPFRLPGQYEDVETGLHYNWRRYYDPRTRRFISSDPLGHRGGFDAYDYVPDPTTWIDPSGLAPEPSDTVPADLHMVGNTTEPKGPRPGTDIDVDSAGMVKGQSYDPANNVFPQGKSATVTPASSGLTGTFHQVPEGTKLPDGIAIVADGADVGGPHGPGHHTIYPTQDMPFSEFESKVKSLPSDPKVKVTKNAKGEVKVTTCG